MVPQKRVLDSRGLWARRFAGFHREGFASVQQLLTPHWPLLQAPSHVPWHRFKPSHGKVSITKDTSRHQATCASCSSEPGALLTMMVASMNPAMIRPQMKLGIGFQESSSFSVSRCLLHKL